MDEAVPICLMFLLFLAALALVKGRIPSVEIAGIHIVLCNPHGITEFTH